jgi:hypothetical protein
VQTNKLHKQVMEALLAAKQVQDPQAWTKFQAEVCRERHAIASKQLQRTGRAQLMRRQQKQAD